jgi:hypothetical protein
MTLPACFVMEYNQASGLFAICLNLSVLEQLEVCVGNRRQFNLCDEVYVGS